MRSTEEAQDIMFLKDVWATAGKTQPLDLMILMVFPT